MNLHALVHAWLAARQAGDLDELASLTGANAVWHSPVDGPQIGRAAVVDEVRRGYANTDAFHSDLLSVQFSDAASATARIRNIATRKGKHLDSVQTLYLDVEDNAVSAVRIEVDDPAAVEAFWS